MTCDECERCRANGYKFCIKCGQSFAEGTEPVPEKKKEGLFNDRTMNKLVVPSMIVALFSVIIDAILVVAGFSSTFDAVQDPTYEGNGLYIYLFVWIGILRLNGHLAQLQWVFIAIALIVSAAVFLYQSRSAFKGGKGYAERNKDTPLFWLALLLGSTLVLEIILTLVISGLGTETSAPSDLNDLSFEKALFWFGEAAVFEEIGFRFLWIGVPMTIVALCMKKKDFYKCLLGGFGMSKIGLVFLVFSTINFAYAHVGGWGLWKMFPVMLGGFAMGYLFMRFGLHVSIMCHMLTDYLGVWLAGSVAFTGLLELLLLLFGLIAVPVLLKKTYQGVRGIKDLPKTGFEDQEESIDSRTD